MRWIIEGLWLRTALDSNQYGVAAAFWWLERVLETIESDAGLRVS